MNKTKNNTGNARRPLWMRIAIMIGVVLLGIVLAWQFLLGWGANRGFEMTATVIQATNESVATSVMATGAAATDMAATRSGPSAIDLTATVVLATNEAVVTSVAQTQSAATGTPAP